MTERPAYEIFVDRGGTFTDCILVEAASGRVTTAKLLSTDDAPQRAVERMLGRSGTASEPITVAMRLGTTLGTNALLERRGAEVVLVTDAGLEDLLRIGTQARPDLFAQYIVRPEPLARTVLGVTVRIDARGHVIGRVDHDELEARLRSALGPGAVVAVVLRFGPLAPSIERELGEVARRAGAVEVVLGHEVVPTPGLLARLETSAIDATLAPVLRRYLATLESAFAAGGVEVMRSDGTLCPASRFRGRDAVLSGPAGGLVAVARTLEALGLERAVSFDMGGTSTDVALVTRDPSPASEGLIAGLRVRAPQLRVHTVAAGGGSLCRADEGWLTVGPESAGAHPGPLCYGAGDATELTLTDVAVALGRVRPDHFAIALDPARSSSALDRMVVADATAARFATRDALAQAFFDIATGTMAQAVAAVTTREGHDARALPMVVFGGAGGQYACAVARALGVRTLLFPRFGSVFSAFGIGLADRGDTSEARLAGVALDEAGLERVGDVFAELEARTLTTLAPRPDERVAVQRLVGMRYVGTESTLSVPAADRVADLRAAFEADHRRLFGIVRPLVPIELVSARVVAKARRPAPTIALEPTAISRAPGSMYVEGARRDVPCLDRAAIAPGTILRGPVVVLEDGGTVVVEPGFEAQVDPSGVLVVTDVRAAAPRARDEALDPVRVELFAGAFMSIANAMGHVLRETARSPNIRDRLDFSCAIFDRAGALVANAPHIPVHLGAMGDSVRAVLSRFASDLAEGDAFLTNDPTAGGSHLPDVTVVAPVFDDAGELRAFVASRGHHPDVGGRIPGSMPAFSSTLDEEGVVIAPTRIVRGELLDADAVLRLFGAGRWPARHPHDNLREVEAQLAALASGRRALAEAMHEHGARVVEAYFGYLHDWAEARVRSALRALPFRGERRFEDALDDGTRVQVRLVLADDGSLEVDFAGTSAVHAGNANAPTAIVKSAVLYVLRLVVGRPMPLNEGCLRAITLRVPTPSLLAPPPEAAVASGNVETSQRIVDVLLGALGLGAAGQGTMNNVTIGNASFSYYETLGGGAGGCEQGPGASAVHTHMTNSRLTDVEVLEESFPLRVVETSIRRGSGGAGAFAGGDGLVREIELMQDASVAVVSERRVLAPRGASGGCDGLPGRNFVDGNPRPGRFEESLSRGARLRVETPGGGGFGRGV